MTAKNHFYSSIILFVALTLSSCDREHAGETISEFTGDYRYYSGIAEFFDCDSVTKYYMFDSKAHQKIITDYVNLGLKEKEDVLLKVKGYLKEVPKIEGVDPGTEFVATEFISFNPDRGCGKARRVGQ